MGIFRKMLLEDEDKKSDGPDPRTYMSIRKLAECEWGNEEHYPTILECLIDLVDVNDENSKTFIKMLGEGARTACDSIYGNVEKKEMETKNATEEEQE